MKGPNFNYEKQVWKKGFVNIGGIDEVGRGSFAGPVVAGCVVFPSDTKSPNIRIDDSKRLSAKQREKASKWIKENALAWGVGEASVAQINKHGIKKASEIAFRKAIINCKVPVNYLLIDAFYIPYVKGLRRRNQKAIVKGDSKSFSIAAASIIAKVYRDGLMGRLGSNPKYKNYLWNKNKGYGTEEHRTAIKTFGPTKHHRKLFVSTYLQRNA